MLGRAFSIVLVTVFFLGIALTSFWALYYNLSDKDSSDNQTEAAYLPDFVPRTEALSKLETVDLNPGSGSESVSASDNVMVDYQLARADSGQILRTEPDASFSLGSESEAAGLIQGLLGMKVGGQRRILVPAELGFGDYGYRDPVSQEQLVPPETDLVYDLTLLARVPLVANRIDSLDIIDLVVGSGDRTVKVGDRIKVDYIGSLARDGLVFDSSHKSGPDDKPALPLVTSLVPAGVIEGAGLIEGWVQGLVGMKIGGLRRLLIPAELAYGDQGSGPVPPDADLVFQVELLDIIESGSEPVQSR